MLFVGRVLRGDFAVGCVQRAGPGGRERNAHVVELETFRHDFGRKLYLSREFQVTRGQVERGGIDVDDEQPEVDADRAVQREYAAGQRAGRAYGQVLEVEPERERRGHFEVAPQHELVVHYFELRGFDETAVRQRQRILFADAEARCYQPGFVSELFDVYFQRAHEGDGADEGYRHGFAGFSADVDFCY